ncbi:hypothetical protein [Qipengyuania profunda]|uniref:hypothetical protein n=1 Tax=Qipengyuania profunda TaxID=3113984 RepID=UPI002A189B69|nr:hypothetical protein [Qipengyuania sp. HL-TH1]WPL57174.1 hypothetical protein SD421_01715 [Qipengyuania sp. HL-TH5]
MSFAALAQRLSQRAALLAAARAEAHLQAHRGFGGQWHRARQLWPLFGRGER